MEARPHVSHPLAGHPAEQLTGDHGCPGEGTPNRTQLKEALQPTQFSIDCAAQNG